MSIRVFLLVLVLGATAVAGMNSGTIVVLAFTSNKAILVADGRMTNTRGEVSDNKCKIAASEERFLFSCAGTAGDDKWDVFEAARRIADKQLSNRRSVTPEQMESISGAWSSEALAWWKSLPHNMVDQAVAANGSHLMVGIFCLRLYDDTILYYIRQVVVDPISYRVDIAGQEYRPREARHLIGAFGQTDVSDQLTSSTIPMESRPQFAQDELAKWGTMPQSEEKDRLKARRIVELTVIYSKERAKVGGDINHAEMDGTGIHWHTKNAECGQ